MPTATTPAYRYAIYLGPADPWRSLGSRWLGRDADSGGRIARGAGAADARIEAWTESPRRYGLHATLKPPFQLADGRTPETLDTAVRALALGFQPFDLALRLERLRDFLAWCAAGDAFALGALKTLADACVAQLDDFRAPLTAAELERYRAEGLTAQQDAHVARWGYPHVFDTFTFHITLTNQLDDAALDAARAEFERFGPADLRRAIASAVAMPVRGIAVYVQGAEDAPFVVARHYGFDGSVRDGAGAHWLAGGV